MSDTPYVTHKNAEPREVTKGDYVLNHVFRIVHEFVTLPITCVALLHNRRIDPAYGLTWRKKFRLTWRMYRNSWRVLTATSFKAHLAMAAKVLEIPPDVEGVVVECGCFLGGSATNLSLVCEIVGRDLILYDSFEGLPPPEKGERYAEPGQSGAFRGSLETVKSNIAAGGVLDVCTFRKGWLKDTLPHHTEPIALLFVDVDLQGSMHDCLINLWPKLVPFGRLFIDEYVLLDYCAVFFSERYWSTYFNQVPPGLYGAGSGVPLGQYYLGPFLDTPPLHHSTSVAYTWKGSTGFWDYYPEEHLDGATGPTASGRVGAGDQADPTARREAAKAERRARRKAELAMPASTGGADATAGGPDIPASDS